MKTCGSANIKAAGPCRGALAWVVRGYFIGAKKTFRDMPLCEHHGPQWNSLHPFGPHAQQSKEQAA